MIRLALALAALAAPAVAQTLSTTGAALPPVAFAAGEMAEVRVDTGGDAVGAAHVVLRPASSNRLLARDRDGFWAPWDGDPDSLPPSAVYAEGAALTFKLFASPPPFLQPWRITVAYRTAEGLKYGVFDATMDDAAGGATE